MKRALVLSGGGVKGAYQAGALDFLINGKKLKFDIVCGSSVGSINAAYLAQYSTSEEMVAIKDLLNMWSSIKQKNVYKQWFPFGWFQFWKKGLYDINPLKQFLTKTINVERIKKSDKQLSLGAVSLTTGQYKIIDKTDPNLIDFIVGSCSIPLLFPPHEINNDLFIDAGIRENVPLQQAIKLGADEIYIISTDTCELNTINAQKSSIIQLTFRFIEIMLLESTKNDISQIEKINKEVELGIRDDKRIIKCFFINPTKQLTENSSKFDHNKVLEMIDTGYCDAKNQIK